MGQRMAQIELAPLAPLPLVASDDVGLDPDGGRNEGAELLRSLAQRRKGTPLERSEEVAVGNERRLDHLGQSGPELPVGQRAQHRGVADDEVWLGEAARHVLVSGHVHAVLAADARVDLGQQRGGHEAEAQAAHVGRGDEPRHVGDDAAPDPQDEGRTVGPQVDEPLVEFADRAERLRGLALTD